MKTIAIDASRANVAQKTGVEWYAFNIIQELKKRIPPEYRVILYTREPLQGELANLPPLWHAKVLSWPPKFLWSQLRLAWELRKNPPRLFFEPSHVVPLYFPYPTVNTLHDVAFARFPKAYSWYGRFYLLMTTLYAVLRGVRFIAVSEFSKREMVELFRANPKNIAVAHLAPSITAAPAPQTEINATYGITAPFFLFVGRLETKKNIGRILAAFGEYCRRTNNNRQLILVGKRGEGYAREMDSYRNEPWFAKVKEIGYAPNAHVAAFFVHANAFVFPSLYEGFGIPALEAMAYGCPVIAGTQTSLPEVVGNAAIMVDPTNVTAIAAAMERSEQPEVRAQLLKNAAQHLVQFSWENTGKKTWEILTQILKE